MASQTGVPASADLTAPTTAAVSASNVLAAGAQEVAPPLPPSVPLATTNLPALPIAQPLVPLASTTSTTSATIGSAILVTPTASAPVYALQAATSTVQKPFPTQHNPSVAPSQYKASPGTITWAPGFGVRANCDYRIQRTLYFRFRRLRSCPTTGCSPSRHPWTRYP